MFDGTNTIMGYGLRTELTSGIDALKASLTLIFTLTLFIWGAVFAGICLMRFSLNKRAVKLVLILLTVLLATQQLSARDQSGPKPLSKSTATSLSLAGTAVPVLAGIVALAASQKEYNKYTHDDGQNKTLFDAGLYLVSGGFILGPGIGYLYARSPQRFVLGTSIRLASLGIIRQYAESSSGVPAHFAFIAILVSGLFDVWNVDNAVEKYNHKLGFADVTIRPGVFCRNNATGLSIIVTL